MSWEVIAAILFFLGVCGVDMIVVDKFFHPRGLIHRIFWLYHFPFFCVAIPAFLFFTGFACRSWRFPLVAGTLIYGGMEDICYYILRGRELPERFDWLPGKPTKGELTLRALLTSVPALLAACML